MIPALVMLPKNLLRIVVSTCLGVGFGLTAATLSAAAQTKSWSADLGRFGVHSVMSESARTHTYKPRIRMAATSEVVAIACGMRELAFFNAGSERWKVPWDVSVLFFAANTGKLLAKAGPWAGKTSFDIYNTRRGKFLLHTRQPQQAGEEDSETLYLLSASAEEVKKLQLQPIPQRVKGYPITPALSASGDTLALSERGSDGTHYKVLDTDTLETRLEWLDTPGAPEMESISDRVMLGGATRQGANAPDKKASSEAVFLREFAGVWRDLPYSRPIGFPKIDIDGLVLRPQTVMLSDDLFLHWENKSRESGGSAEMVRADGSSTALQLPTEPAHGISFPESLIVSQNGRYLGLMGKQENPGSHFLLDVLKMDVTFWQDERFIVVWEARHAEPLGTINLGTEVRSISFAGEDLSGIAFVDGVKLKFVPLPMQHGSPSAVLR